MIARAIALAACSAGLLVAASTDAGAQSATKKDLVQRVLQAQQTELESVSRGIVERPAVQMMQEAALAIQRQVPLDKRESTGKAIEAEVKKYIDEAYPLVRERAIKLAPSTIGAVLEEKMSEDELKQLVAWLESSANKKFQALGPDMRNAFIQKVLADARPVVDPKVQALDGRIRVILGLPPAQPVGLPGSAPTPTRPGAVSTKVPTK